ncbi:helix-turn-helix domain-containing protein [Aeromicrobium sp. 9AM]|uniref:helix-turn-helix domain-containing protein n=1 Tax=Aeromicrobium sp. 9AM TaxID=2653126 RepID=UPI0012F39C7D|nr:helix-turn-helix transcriptional regulator [Aeromicrobium sp. 9AM]VXB83463.1 DNA-binding transcriptional regulator, XRE-family HTH domain [Aeromicrobium sp. 9AM]
MSEKTKRQNGHTIRHFRIKGGMKPGEFATLARISYSTLDNIENERRNASPEVLHRIAIALDVPVEALIRDAKLFASEQVPA